MLRRFGLLLAFFFLPGLIQAQAPLSAPAAGPAREGAPPVLQGKTVCICDDGAEWPPYTYYQRIEKKKQSRIEGFSVDVIREIFAPRGLAFTVELIPWKRCQKEVEIGKYQMFLNGSYNEERARKYYISEPYYTTTSCYFYSRKIHPQGLSIGGLADLSAYRVGGMLGYNYQPYGLDDKAISPQCQSFEALIKALHTGRCDLFLEKLEILAGFAVTGEDLLKDPDLGYGVLPGIEAEAFYMMFTRNPAGEALKQMVDEGIAELTASGRIKEMLKKYVPE